MVQRNQIVVDDEVHKQLSLIKINKGMKSLNDVIKYLMRSTPCNSGKKKSSSRAKQKDATTQYPAPTKTDPASYATNAETN